LDALSIYRAFSSRGLNPGIESNPVCMTRATNRRCDFVRGQLNKTQDEHNVQRYCRLSYDHTVHAHTDSKDVSQHFRKGVPPSSLKHT